MFACWNVQKYYVEEQAELVIAIEQGTDPKSALQAKGDQKGIRNVIGELARFLNKMEKAIGGPRIQEIERLGWRNSDLPVE